MRMYASDFSYGVAQTLRPGTGSTAQNAVASEAPRIPRPKDRNLSPELASECTRLASAFPIHSSNETLKDEGQAPAYSHPRNS